MEPHQVDPNYLPAVGSPSDARLASTHKTPLRTYSRRSLKRRHTSLPAQNGQRSLTRTASLNVTDQETAAQCNEVNNRQPSRPILNKGRKRVRFFLASKENKTPNDLAWEALASSTPELTRQGDDFPEEGGPCEAHVVDCSPGHKGSEPRRPTVENALNGSTTGSEGQLRGDAASEADALENASLEESDDVEDGKLKQLLPDHERH